MSVERTGEHFWTLRSRKTGGTANERLESDSAGASPADCPGLRGKIADIKALAAKGNASKKDLEALVEKAEKQKEKKAK